MLKKRRCTELGTGLALAVLFVALGDAQTVTLDSGRALAIPMLSPAEMSGADSRLAASMQSAIRRSALIYGYTVDAQDAAWHYKQIACPAAPNDLLLAYEAFGSSGVTSSFTAVIRRGDSPHSAASPGGVEIIPVLHFGVVPFIAAEANPHSFEIFNRIVAPIAPVPSELLAGNPLLVRSLCFVAMMGEPPVILGAPSLDPATLRAPVPTLLFLENRAVQVRFSVRNSGDAFQVWTLTFSSRGELLAAAQEEHAIDRPVRLANAAAPGMPQETAPIAAGSSLALESQHGFPVEAMPAVQPAAASDQPSSATVALPGKQPLSPAIAPPVTAQPSSVAESPASPNATKATPSAQAPVPAGTRYPASTITLPLPPRRVITDLPQPPRRLIPKSEMTYPPQTSVAQ